MTSITDQLSRLCSSTAIRNASWSTSLRPQEVLSFCEVTTPRDTAALPEMSLRCSSESDRRTRSIASGFMNLAMNGVDAMKPAVGSPELTLRMQRDVTRQLVISACFTGVARPREANTACTQVVEWTKTSLEVSSFNIGHNRSLLCATSNSGHGRISHFTLPTKSGAWA